MFNFDFTFAYPWFLLLMLAVPAVILRRLYFGRKKETSVIFSSAQFFEGYTKSWRERLAFLPFALRMLALVVLIIALARPQKFSTGENVYTEGIDIAIILDISGSMLAEDFKPNRLDAAKKITDSFIEGRTTDQIGLVIFSRDAFTQCPLTIDYSVLRNLLKDIKSGMIEDGTAIGNAIANGINRLKDSRAKSKVMILLTDGVNNAGEVNPVTAAEMAKQFGIRIYSIGVGTIGQAPYPFQTPFGIRYQMVPVEIDEPVLKQISGMTGAKYFRATSNRKLEEIYTEIDRLEKTRVEVTSYRTRKELFPLWLYLGLFFILGEVILSKTILRRLP